MKTLELQLKNEAKETIKVHLRLTAGAQMQLKEETGEETMSTLLNSINDIEDTIKVFNASLNYKNNDNTITDGEELYDLLVDNDKAGVGDFAKIITDIAVNSGIITKPQANSLIKSVTKTYDSIFNELDSIATSESVIGLNKGKETPTK